MSLSQHYNIVKVIIIEGAECNLNFSPLLFVFVFSRHKQSTAFSFAEMLHKYLSIICSDSNNFLLFSFESAVWTRGQQTTGTYRLVLVLEGLLGSPPRGLDLHTGRSLVTEHHRRSRVAGRPRATVLRLLLEDGPRLAICKPTARLLIATPSQRVSKLASDRRRCSLSNVIGQTSCRSTAVVFFFFGIFNGGWQTACWCASATSWKGEQQRHAGPGAKEVQPLYRGPTSVP